MIRLAIAAASLVLVLMTSPAHADCAGVPINGKCQGDLLIYCAFDVQLTVQCSAFGKTCGVETLFGLVPVHACVEGASACGGVQCGGGCGSCTSGQVCNVYGACVIPGCCWGVCSA